MPGTSRTPTSAAASPQRPQPSAQHTGSTTVARRARPNDSTPDLETTPAHSGARLIPRPSWYRRHATFLGVLLIGLALRFSDGLEAGVVVQHALSLATGVVLYALMLRWGVWRWLAALATVPVLLVASVLAGERLALPDTLAVFVVSLALLVLGWRTPPTVLAAFTGGVLLAVVATIGLAGAPLALVALVFLVLAGGTWASRAAAVLAASIGFALVVVPYVAWYPAAGVEAQVTLADQLGADAWVSYRQLGQVPEPLLLGCLIVGLLASAGVWRAGCSGMRAVCLLATLIPVMMTLGADTDVASWRSGLPGLVLLPAAGALGATALLRGQRGAAASRPQTDDIDRSALAAFDHTYGDLELAPVVVVIAAYNEADGLPGVLSGLPTAVCGLPCDVVVVDDGSSDGTATTARTGSDAYVVACPLNRGQGAAMRLGYRVARDHGASYIITTDADGQYETADFPTVLAPVLDGSADFVTGSRRLGRQHTRDRFRRTGVYVFAWIVNLLTGQRLTDTSFGLRAMRAEVTAAVTLNQPQYQSSELLIGAHSHGFRITEVPATMHQRSAGSTKKGGNLVYGTRYARIVFGTWWREGCPAPAQEIAPALAGRPHPSGAAPSTGR